MNISSARQDADGNALLIEATRLQADIRRTCANENLEGTEANRLQLLSLADASLHIIHALSAKIITLKREIDACDSRSNAFTTYNAQSAKLQRQTG